MLTPMAKKLSAALVAAVTLSLVGSVAPASAARIDSASVKPAKVKPSFIRDTGWDPV